MEMKGYVKVKGKWIPAREADQLAALAERKRLRKQRQKEARDFQRKLRKLVQLIAYGTGKQSVKAHDELVTIARENGDPAMEKFAGDVKAYFDRYWQVVREKATALTEVRATMSRLKRPIPTFTTSLGAGSTPVTLQLPELSIISVKTTVPIPAGR